MDIKVVGAGCDKCDRLYANTVSAVSALGLDEKVEKVEDLIEIVKLGVMQSPSLLVDGKIVIAGRIPKEDEIKKILQNR